MVAWGGAGAAGPTEEEGENSIVSPNFPEFSITQGSTAYASGAEYKFSVFKTKATATGGKKNETAVGYFEVTGEP